MSVAFTDGFVLLWDIASLEAQAATFDQILPEHLFIALCKSGDIPIGALRDDGSPAIQKRIPVVEREVRQVCRTFDAAGFDRLAARRQIRAALGRPCLPPPSDGVWHRDKNARWCCDRALYIARARGQEKATPYHLLQAFLDSEACFPRLEPVITDVLRQIVAQTEG